MCHWLRPAIDLNHAYRSEMRNSYFVHTNFDEKVEKCEFITLNIKISAYSVKLRRNSAGCVNILQPELRLTAILPAGNCADAKAAAGKKEAERCR
ncbi:hypothetical protein [Roseibium album]|uniref:hypothetical protein n=1 Tax=Roseibium album TaxID=311410 RepID=UPI00329786F2